MDEFVPEELLFYGTSLNFALADIAEAADHAKRPKELRMLNPFEQTVQNEHMAWTVDEEAMEERVRMKIRHKAVQKRRQRGGGDRQDG